AILLDDLSEMYDTIETLLCFRRIGDVDPDVTRGERKAIPVDEGSKRVLLVPVLQHFGKGLKSVEAKGGDILDSGFEGSTGFGATRKRPPGNTCVADLQVSRSRRERTGVQRYSKGFGKSPAADDRTHGPPKHVAYYATDSASDAVGM